MPRRHALDLAELHGLALGVVEAIPAGVLGQRCGQPAVNAQSDPPDVLEDRGEGRDSDACSDQQGDLELEHVLGRRAERTVNLRESRMHQA